MCDGSGATSWIYDSMGRPTIETRTLNGVTKNIGYIYFVSGHLSSLFYPSGHQMYFDVNAAGQTYGEVDSSYNYVFGNASFTPNGALTGMWQYSHSGTYTVGINSHFLYNKRLQPALSYAIISTGGVTNGYLYQRCYDYHLLGGLNVSYGGITCSSTVTSPGDNGNVYQIVNKLDDNRTQNFVYDPLNRAYQAYTNGSNWGQQFSIDAWGNLTGVSALSGKVPVGVFTSSATGANQLTGFSYDTAGNMLSDGNGTITYDAENRISGTAGVSYTYDGDGQRVEKSNGTLYWTGVGSNALAESDLSGNISKEYVFFNGMLVSRVNRSTGVVDAFLTDHLGSARMLVTPSGTNALTVDEDLDYTPYGIVATGTAADHYEFNGKERDTESGLDNFGARYNASSLGRFMTPDWAAKPIDVPYAKFGDPQTLNLYSYVENAPVNRIDPDGHEDSGGAGGSTSSNNTANANADVQTNDQRVNAKDQKGSTQAPKVGDVAPYNAGAGSGVDCHSGTCTAVRETVKGDNRTGVTVTRTEATFSSEKGHEGEFMGAKTTATNYTVGNDGLVSSVSTTSSSIGYGQARSTIGGAMVDSAIEAALPSGVALFASALVQDHHSVVQGGTAAAGLGCMLAEPCGAAVAVGSGVVGAVDFAAEKLKWW